MLQRLYPGRLPRTPHEVEVGLTAWERMRPPWRALAEPALIFSAAVSRVYNVRSQEDASWILQ